MIEPPRIFENASQLPVGTALIDARDSSLRELFPIRNPREKKGTGEFNAAQESFVKESTISSLYVYYPWLKKAIKTLPEAEYFELRTARNRNIITNDEQRAYRAGSVAIAGLSVGSSILHALVMTGGPKHLKIADFDVVETTNLNRLRAGLPDIGASKVEVAARTVWELDPFAQIELFDQGVTDENIESFALHPRVDILIDEMESIEYKLKLRFLAKREKIPVLMATDNGNGIILDVERFDLEPDRPVFHGLLSDIAIDQYKNLSQRDWLRIAMKLITPEYLDESMRKSVLEIGTTIPSVPQLGTSATFAGAAMAYATRLMLNRKALPSGRYHYSLEHLIDLEYSAKDYIERQKSTAEAFAQRMRALS